MQNPEGLWCNIALRSFAATSDVKGGMSYSGCTLRIVFSMIGLLFLLASFGSNVGNANTAAVEAASPPTKTYSVTSFGAKGDGTTDDGIAIQKAMSAAARDGGGHVTFPCGEFAVKSLPASAPGGRSALFLKNVNNVQLIGRGHCTHVFTVLQQKSIFEFANSNHVSVTRMRISVPNAVYVESYGMDGGSAIRFTGVSYGSITTVEVDGATAGALYLTAGTSNSTVANNFIHDTYGSGLWEDDCGASSTSSCSPARPPANNIFESNTLTNTSLAMLSAIVLDNGGSSSHTIVKDNVISWNHAPLSWHNEVHCIQIGNAADVSILNNLCKATPWDAIAVTTGGKQKSQHITIQGNTIVSSGTSSLGGSGIVVYDDPSGGGISDFTIAHNSISTAAADGIRIYAASKQDAIHDGQVLNNSISMVDQRAPSTRFGIDIEFSTSITVASNTITGDGKCIAYGVNVHSSSRSAPTPSSNKVTNILGKTLQIQ